MLSFNKKNFASSFRLSKRKEKIENGIWIPSIFENYRKSLAVGAMTKQMTIKEKKPEIRVVAFSDRFDILFSNQDPDIRRKKIFACRSLISFLKRLNVKDYSFALRAMQQPYLVHENDVATVDKKYLVRKKTDLAREKADGMITNLREVPLLIRAADCAPVIIYDPKNNAVGVFHSGWRGTTKAVVLRGAKEMSKKYGSLFREMIVAVGPYAGGDQYEVSEETLSFFLKCGFYEKQEIDLFFKPNKKKGHYFLDTGKAIFISLLKAGFLAENIQVSRYSTMSEEGNYFFTSERKEGRENRDYFAVMVILK